MAGRGGTKPTKKPISSAEQFGVIRSVGQKITKREGSMVREVAIYRSPILLLWCLPLPARRSPTKAITSRTSIPTLGTPMTAERPSRSTAGITAGAVSWCKTKLRCASPNAAQTDQPLLSLGISNNLSRTSTEHLVEPRHRQSRCGPGASTATRAATLTLEFSMRNMASLIRGSGPLARHTSTRATQLGHADRAVRPPPEGALWPTRSKARITMHSHVARMHRRPGLRQSAWQVGCPLDVGSVSYRSRFNKCHTKEGLADYLQPDCIPVTN